MVAASGALHRHAGETRGTSGGAGAEIRPPPSPNESFVLASLLDPLNRFEERKQVNAMSGNINNKVRHELNKQVASGFRKHCAKNGGMVVNNEKKSAKEIDSDLRRRAGAEDAVTLARAALHGAVLERQKIEAETNAVFAAVRQTALIMAGNTPEILADFGLSPRKGRRSLSLEEKTAAVDKQLLTKKARHVMGRRQRLEIRAEATPAVATEPAAPPAPAPAAHPPAPEAKLPPIVVVVPPTPIAPAATPPTPIAPVTNGAAVVHGGGQ